MLGHIQFPLALCRSWGLTSPFYGPKARKDDFQVLICGHWVQFAHKQHILWRPHICIREVTHLEECMTEDCISVCIFGILNWSLRADFFFSPSPAEWPESWLLSPSTSPPIPRLLSHPHRRSPHLLRFGHSAHPWQKQLELFSSIYCFYIYSMHFFMFICPYKVCWAWSIALYFLVWGKNVRTVKAFLN